MSARFLFFGTGASFTLAVLNRLVELNQFPLAVVLPEYPPARQNLSPALQISFKHSRNPLVEKANVLKLATIYSPEAFEPQLVDLLRTMQTDFLLVACWPYRLSGNITSLVTKAALNLHPSLLPKFRGANPVEQQLHSSDRDFGVSLHLLDEQFDTGNIVKQSSINMSGARIALGPIEYRAAITGVDLFLKAMDEFGTPAWKPREQN